MGAGWGDGGSRASQEKAGAASIAFSTLAPAKCVG